MENVEKFKEIGDSGYIYQNELDKACFQRSLSYGDCKDLSRRAASEKKIKKCVIKHLHCTKNHIFFSQMF